MCSMNSAVCMQTWKTSDESNSVDLQHATFLTYPFFLTLEDNHIFWMTCAKNATTFAQASHKVKEERQQCAAVLAWKKQPKDTLNQKCRMLDTCEDTGGSSKGDC